MNPIRSAFRYSLKVVSCRRVPFSRLLTVVLLTFRSSWRIVFWIYVHTLHRLITLRAKPSIRYTRYAVGALFDLLRSSSASREVEWTETNLQKILNGLTVRLQRARRPWLRVVFLLASALQKYRERIYASTVNVAATIDRPLDQTVLRNFVAFQYNIRRNPTIPPQASVNLLLRVDPSVRDARMCDLFSVFCASTTFSDLTLHWDHGPADAAESQILTLPELRARGAGLFARPPLSSVRQDIVNELEHCGAPDAFQPLNDARRNANNYLKMTFDWRFAIAVSFREKRDGSIESELDIWMPILDELEREFDTVRFCVLNRASRENNLSRRSVGRFAFACESGLSVLDSLALARQANAYFGVLDIYGLAAKTAGVPGVYLPLAYELEEGDVSLPSPDQHSLPLWKLEYLSRTIARDALRQVLKAIGADKL